VLLNGISPSKIGYSLVEIWPKEKPCFSSMDFVSFTVEFPPPKEKSPVFSQLEKMIKLTAFDQKKFQKQVRVAAGLEIEEAKEEIKDKMKEPDVGKLIKAKSKSRSKSPVPRNDASKDGNGYRRMVGDGELGNRTFNTADTVSVQFIWPLFNNEATN
jgi:hypothetical protein